MPGAEGRKGGTKDCSVARWSSLLSMLSRAIHTDIA